jgi:hypothetical protein
MDLRHLHAKAVQLAARYQRYHFTVFNVGVRLVGIAFTLVSILALYSGIYYAIRPDAAADFGTTLVSPAADTIGVSIFIGLIGVALLCIRPYRPDLGDPAWSVSRTPGPMTKRRWWTGGLK